MNAAVDYAGFLALPTEAAESLPSDWELYVPRGDGQRLALYRGRDVEISTSNLATLVSRGIEKLYVRCGDAEKIIVHLRDHVVSNPDIPRAARVGALAFVARAALEKAFRKPDCDQLVALTSDLGREFADLLADRAVALTQLLRLVNHDYYTYTHVCNVSLYSLSLARALGITDQRELAAIATGALLHDIGKRKVPAHILNKRGRLLEKEWDHIRRHPLEGYRDLVHQRDVDWGQLMMVYQHHERMDGEGYPTGVMGEEIHLWARICTVADVFDAMTSQRPYRNPMPIADVGAHMLARAGTSLDAEVVKCLSELMVIAS